ncbi:formin-binding protein 4 [Cebus imitator]|uniref:formin-binding protein 4 n=1 Tax=Cebus imitator TaxID=2715852 RepID=UPI001898FF20|nr:formin-binding protein 4 [Cebus imitator]
MGKKSRAVPGRRPILQLSPPGPRGSTPGRDPEPEPDPEPDSTAAAPSQPAPAAAATTTTTSVTAAAAPDDSSSEGKDEQEVVVEVPRVVQNPPKPVMTTRPTAVKATGGLCLLGAYADSDDDDNDVSEKPAQSKETNGNQSTDIDSTLANFLAVSGALVWGFSYFDFLLVGIEMGDWQEVWDENTGCYYYWNTQTNEVTWELPQYLATQVQGLQHYQPSSVPGAEASFVVNTEIYTKEKTVSISSSKSGPVIAKREVKKEVNEGIQALSNSEEEKKGVAASLLAPLLPEGIKEEEERWRRKVICKEEPVSEVKEISTTVEEAATMVKPQEIMLDNIEDPSQEDLCSVVQSGESEEEEEQDTLELELVLERKKAELRALEEGDGSVSGSSPRSDVSQPASQDGMRRLMSKRGKWKMFVRATSPESTSRSSSKTGRDTPENGETVIGAENSEKIDENSDKEVEVEESPEKIKVQTTPKVEEEQDLKFQIGELANTLTSKFEFLGINRQSISNFHVLLLQTETRIADWREGALNGNYLKRKLQDAAEQLKQYEINATPKGWSCHWDRDHRRYFYVNEQSGESQWEFPDGEEEEDESQAQESRDETLAKQTLKDKTGTDSNSTESSENSTGSLCKEPFSGQVSSSSLMPFTPFWTLLQSNVPVLQPPLPLEMPPPPPPPPESPPPPPPPPPPVEDGEIQEVEMEDEGSEEPPAPGTEEDTPLKPSAQTTVVTTQSSVDSTSSSSPSTKGIKRKATEISTAVVQRSATIGSSPVLYSQSAIATGNCRALWLKPDKAKKSKTKMPSLVKKWQSIQRELDEEDNSSSSEEDRESTAQKRIEEWKQQQLVSGMAERNANFEALPEDWRARLKRRKMAPNT